jgi:hypothetical protein
MAVDDLVDSGRVVLAQLNCGPRPKGTRWTLREESCNEAARKINSVTQWHTSSSAPPVGRRRQLLLGSCKGHALSFDGLAYPEIKSLHLRRHHNDHKGAEGASLGS